jgi:cytochrome P450
MAEQGPEYARERSCPFDPPDGLTALEGIDRVQIWDGSQPWIISSYDEHKQILGDPRVSNDVRRPGYPFQSAAFKQMRTKGHLAFDRTDAPVHTQQRRMLTADFTVKRVQSQEPTVQQYVDEIFDGILRGPKPADLVKAVAHPVPALMICDLLGTPKTEMPFFRRCFDTIANTREDPDVVLSTNQELIDYIERLVDENIANPSESLVGRLISDQLNKDTMSRADLVAMTRVVLSGGYDTTANMIAMSILLLLLHPDQLDELRGADGPTLLPNAIEELLRYLSVTHFGRRRVATEDIELNGHVIQAGEGIIAQTDVANRDSRAFTGDPNTFDIHRPAGHHVAFGFGPHQCLGQSLARLELRVVLSTFVRRMPETVRLAIPFEDVEFKNETQVYGIRALPVMW